MSIRILRSLAAFVGPTRLNQYSKRWPVPRSYVRRSSYARQGNAAAIISILLCKVSILAKRTQICVRREVVPVIAVAQESTSTNAMYSKIWLTSKPSSGVNKIAAASPVRRLVRARRTAIRHYATLGLSVWFAQASDCLVKGSHASAFGRGEIRKQAHVIRELRARPCCESRPWLNRLRLDAFSARGFCRLADASSPLAGRSMTRRAPGWR
jgi:hypothetical protein